LKTFEQQGSVRQPASSAEVDTDLQQTLDALADFSAFLTSLVEAWPSDAYDTQPAQGGRSLAAYLCYLRDVEIDRFGAYIRKLLWCDNPVLDASAPDHTRSDRPWRIVLYELFQARLGNVSVLRRTDAKTFERSGSLGPHAKFRLGNLVDAMREHDIAAMADLFALATECGHWPANVPPPA
jgi:hypothetical protein